MKKKKEKELTEFISPAEAARMMGMSRRTIYNYLKQGKLSYMQAGPRKKISIFFDSFMWWHVSRL